MRCISIGCAVAIGGALAALACESRAMTTADVVTLFGPATNTDIISGHVADERGRVWLLAGGSRLVSVDIDRGTAGSVTLKLPPHEECWGLARLADDTIWTLMGWNLAAQLGPDGSIERTIELPVAHLGLFGAGDRLVFQQASLPPNTPALFAALPDDPRRTPWSALRTRSFDALATGAAAALNLVACGVSRSGEIPCWFPDEPVVWLVAPDGATRRVDLPGLPRVAPELLINAKAPARPIRDVYVERDGTMWVLSTGTVVPGERTTPGGRVLARFDARGAPIDRRILRQPVRLILRARDANAVVLTGDGMISEVTR